MIYDVTSEANRSDRFLFINSFESTQIQGSIAIELRVRCLYPHTVCQYRKLANSINRSQTLAVIDDGDDDDQLGAIIQRQERKIARTQYLLSIFLSLYRSIWLPSHFYLFNWHWCSLHVCAFFVIFLVAKTTNENFSCSSHCSRQARTRSRPPSFCIWPCFGCITIQPITTWIEMEKQGTNETIKFISK